MSILGNLTGSTGIAGGVANAAQGMIGSSSLSPYPTLVGSQPTLNSPLMSKNTLRPITSISFVVQRALNGYVVISQDTDKYDDCRYIASTVEEVKDLVASLLVQQKLQE